MAGRVVEGFAEEVFQLAEAVADGLRVGLEVGGGRRGVEAVLDQCGQRSDQVVADGRAFAVEHGEAPGGQRLDQVRLLGEQQQRQVVGGLHEPVGLDQIPGDQVEDEAGPSQRQGGVGEGDDRADHRRPSGETFLQQAPSSRPRGIGHDDQRRVEVISEQRVRR